MPSAIRACRPRRMPVRCGLGQCRLCSCHAFRGRGNVCEDCRHHYDDHTTKPFRTGESSPRQTANLMPEPNAGEGDR
jgi:hypothetical protein